MITIETNITPVPAGRPRVTRYNTYYPKRHTRYTKEVTFTGKPKQPIESMVSVNTTYAIPLPKSMSKKKRIELDASPCDKHIDLDNLNKLFYDCVLVDGGVIKDDSLIVIETSKKIWTSDDEGYTLCIIEEL